MGLRTLAFVFGVATALSAPLAMALGLGGIKLNSALNQPLNAQIELLQVRDLSEQEILVGLASLEDFERVGVDRTFFLSSLDFTIDLDAAGGPVILVTSEQPVREPFLNFVVEAQWPSGRLLREYTLLMDLPVFSEEKQVQPVQPTQVQPSRKQPTRPDIEPAQPATVEPLEQPHEEQPLEEQPVQTATRPEEKLTPGAAAGADRIYGPVKVGDALWNIAAASRPDSSISIQQTMLAIQRANPGAFINNNINLLRRGQVLRIPSAEEMTSLSRREAIAEVAYQNQRWSGGGDATVEAPQLEGSKSYTSAEPEITEPRGQVKLASPEEYSSSTEGRGTGQGAGSTEALENELAVTLEELDKSKSENAELKSRIAAMEAQIETMERLVEVSSEEMRALQLAAQKTAQQTDQKDQPASEQPAATKESDSPAPADQQQGDTGKADAEQAESDVSEPVPAPEAESTEVEKAGDAETKAETQPQDTKADDQKKPAKVPAPAPLPEPKASVLDLILDNILFVVLGFVALIAGIALYLRARARAEDEDEFDGFPEEGVVDEFQEVDVYDEEHQPEENFDDLELENEHEELLALDADEDHLTEQETEDAVAEADIYIALAKYDQAEEILLRALDKEPNDAHIRLKLLELYAAQQDLENFDPHFAKLRVLADDDINERAEELRGKIAGAPEFDETQFSSGATATSAVAEAEEEMSAPEDDLLLDLDAGSDSDYAAAAPKAELEESSDDDFGDFDLDLGDDFDSAPVSSAAATPAAESDDDLDFDFDLDDDALTVGEEATGTDIEDTEITADDLDFGEEFTLDLDTGEAEASAEEEAPESEKELDLGSMDLDLDSSFSVESDADEKLEEDESDFDFDLNDELKADISATTHSDEPAPSIDEQKEESFLLDDLDNDFDEVDTLEDALDLESSAASTESIDTEDELDLDADMDLSALDEELDAMTAELDTFFDEPSAGKEPSASGEPSAGVEPSASGEPSASDISEDLELPDLEEPLEAEESQKPEPGEFATGADLSGTDFELHDIDPEADDDSDLGFLSDSDETATKLDLARAYMDMGDTDGAKDILEEIMQEGNEEQRSEAQQLLERV